MRSFAIVAMSLLLTQCLACTPRIKVTANPTTHTKGIRYYRPKPYLLITSGSSETKTENNSSTTRQVGDPRLVNIQLQYLPDFEEEYALDVRTGFGSANVGIKLEDGWKLTEVNQDLDSQTDDNIKAASDLLANVTSLATGASKAGGMADGAGSSFQVLATNVPLGYYESVVGRDNCGRKRLYGFRYVGFMPFQGCPTVMTGVECNNCQSSEVYGLVFDHDVMVFKPLGIVQSIVPPSDIVQETPQQEDTPNSQVKYNIKAGTIESVEVNLNEKLKRSTRTDGTPQLQLPTVSPVLGN